MSSFLEQVQMVLAQAPVNDVVGWPSGMLLLATVVYAALGNSSTRLFEIDPSIGLFLFRGLPVFALKPMGKVRWASTRCHFVSGVRTAYGISNFWVRGESVTPDTRKIVLDSVLEVLSPVIYENRDDAPLDTRLWRPTPAGLVIPSDVSNPTSLPISTPETAKRFPAMDFIYFSAIQYHVFHEWVVEVEVNGKRVFTTQGLPPNTVIDVENETSALYVVAAAMIRRPHSQSPLRNGPATREVNSSDRHYIVSLDQVDRNAEACEIDMHSYSSPNAKIRASLSTLARAYCNVVQHIKMRADCPNYHRSLTTSTILARVNVGQSLWIGILGGGLLDQGRLTIQNLPGRRASGPVLIPNYHYSERVEAVVQLLKPTANNALAVEDNMYSDGISRNTTLPFMVAGILGQGIICYFLAVGTTAGVWTSVALANSLFAGQLLDLHSVWWGKNSHTQQPGFKLLIPGTKDIMCVATLDRSTPRHANLRQGFILNAIGLAAAAFGAVFQVQTRESLGFQPVEPSPPWVSYTAVTLCLGTTLLITLLVTTQQAREKTWFDDSEFPSRWMIYSTVFPALAVSALAIYFQRFGMEKYWPVLDAITWISGLPLGMIENGMVFSVDDNLLHLALLNRWIMGAVASSVGSSIPSGNAAGET